MYLMVKVSENLQSVKEQRGQAADPQPPQNTFGRRKRALRRRLRHPCGCAKNTFSLLGKLWGGACQVGWQSQARRRWHKAQVHLSGEGVGDPAEPGDGGVSD